MQDSSLEYGDCGDLGVGFNKHHFTSLTCWLRNFGTRHRFRHLLDTTDRVTIETRLWMYDMYHCTYYNSKMMVLLEKKVGYCWRIRSQNIWSQNDMHDVCNIFIYNTFTTVAWWPLILLYITVTWLLIFAVVRLYDHLLPLFPQVSGTWLLPPRVLWYQYQYFASPENL